MLGPGLADGLLKQRAKARVFPHFSIKGVHKPADHRLINIGMKGQSRASGFAKHGGLCHDRSFFMRYKGLCLSSETRFGHHSLLKLPANDRRIP